MIRRARRPRRAPERFNVCDPERAPVKPLTKKRRAPIKKKPMTKRATLKQRKSVRRPARANVAKKTKTKKPSDEECRKLVGQCVRIDWPVVNSPEEGEYTAMVFSYVAKSKKHKLFYYATAESEESFEEVDLFDGSRHWHVEQNPAMRHPLPGEGAPNAPDPRNLIGRRVWVAWPDEKTGKPKSYDAVIVDYVRATEFRIVYVDDEWVENRDLVSSELAWELYEVAPSDKTDTGRGQDVSGDPVPENRSSLGLSGHDLDTSSAKGTLGSRRGQGEGGSVSAQGAVELASSGVTADAGAPRGGFQEVLQATVAADSAPPRAHSTRATTGDGPTLDTLLGDDPPPLPAIPPGSHPLHATHAAGANPQGPPRPTL